MSNYQPTHIKTMLRFCHRWSQNDASKHKIPSTNGLVLQWCQYIICSIFNSFNSINPLRPRQNGRRVADDPFKCIFLNENVIISIKISLKFVPNVRITNIPALVQIMAWCRPGDKPLSEPIIVSLMTHVCVTRPRWIKHDQLTRPVPKPHFRNIIYRFQCGWHS